MATNLELTQAVVLLRLASVDLDLSARALLVGETAAAAKWFNEAMKELAALKVLEQAVQGERKVQTIK